MWFDKGQFNTIAYPLDQLPSISEKRSLTGSLSESELVRRREESERLLDELRSAVHDPPEGAGHFEQQVDDDTIEAVDWSGVIARGDFESIRFLPMNGGG
ncbi:MAG: hypothetical protein JWO18_315 [Microbacteriaceae bacterium]|nr:hypothetical protein [Microbacteriaceae bacterium]